MRLFVYGTLHPDRAPAEIADVVRRFRYVADATVEGELRHLPDYPALRLETLVPASVQGAVFELPADPEILRRLDVYEGFHPESPEASLFVRCELDVRLLDGRALRCWIYTYRQPFPVLP